MNDQKLEQKIGELKKLCGELDPFSKISKSHRKLLSKYGLNEISDPFELSNRLILLVESALTQKMKREEKQVKGDEKKSTTTIH